MTVDVPREVARRAVRIADRENIAIEDALRRLMVQHRRTEGGPWFPAEAPVMVVAVDVETEDRAVRFAFGCDLPTVAALGRPTAYDYPTDVVAESLGVAGGIPGKHPRNEMDVLD